MPSSEPDTPDYQLFPRVVPEGWSGKLRIQGDYAHSRLVPGVKYGYEIRSMRWHADTDRKREPLKGNLRADAKGRLTIPFEPDIGGEWVVTVTSEDKRIRVLPVLGLYVIYLRRAAEPAGPATDPTEPEAEPAGSEDEPASSEAGSEAGPGEEEASPSSGEPPEAHPAPAADPPASGSG